MHNRRICFSLLVVAFMMVLTNPALRAQISPASQHTSIAVKLALDKDSVTKGESPLATLTVTNLTKKILPIHDSSVRVYLEDRKGERPMTLNQRLRTGKLHAGDVQPSYEEMWLWEINPNVSSGRKYDLEGFYDIGDPGQYSVYMEVLDPTSGKWLRTNTARFDVVSTK